MEDHTKWVREQWEKQKARVAELMQAEEWIIWGRNYNSPSTTVESNLSRGDWIPLVRVFEAMNLDLAILSQVFPVSPSEKDSLAERNQQGSLEPTAPSYGALGGCHIDDHDAWRTLAKLCNKRLKVAYFLHGKDMSPEREIIYEP